MENAIQVSIILNSFNHEKYIKDALDGIVKQKVNFQFEVLVHDDASTDGTVGIIKNYIATYPHIYFSPIFQSENQYSKKIKIGATYQYPRAQGKYIAICEGDDYWTDPLKLQKQFDFMETYPHFALCTHDFLVHYEHRDISSNFKASENFKYLTATPIGETRFYQYTVNDFAKHLDGLHTATNFFRTEILLRVFSRISMYVSSGDYLLKLLLLKEGKGCFIPDVMSVLRKNPGGITQQAKNPISYFNSQEHQLSLFAEIAPPETKKYFYRRLWKIYPNYILGRGYTVPLKDRVYAIKPFFTALLKSI